MAIIGIVAVDRNGAIGKGGGLPWHYSADMKFFKEQTKGNACVMGYKTWLTLKRPLPGRLNVVLTRRADTEPRESVVWVRDRQSVLSLKDYLRCDLFVIGGAQVFEMFREEIDRWLVTEVPLAVEGADTFMPADFLEGFRAYDSRALEGDLKVTFYERTR
ncbi:MAG: dihydrofolate reductase [Acidobacteriota bacterium]|jgi:dihydrofolate reductase|nr:dihydrofolate reductase [Acidobacteriota bacterium]MDT7779013.1 dihydrofolate reductase [Acidobacteriota bacterium]